MNVALRQKSWPGAIVLGSDFKALGVVRSLGRQGIPSIVIDNLPRSAWFSRYVVKHFLWHGSMDNTAFFDFLLQISQKHSLEQWVLFPLAMGLRQATDASFSSGSGGSLSQDMVPN